MITNILPSITDKQKEILHYLYQFRFLHTYHFQKLFKHKDAHRVKEWLKDLVKKGYLSVDYKKDSFPHKPAIYSLTKLSRKLLKKDSEYGLQVLNLVYRKNELSQQFIEHQLSLADLYLYFLSKQEKGSTLEFFTQYELFEYEYLKPLAFDAYIEVKSKRKTTRYFLHLFDSFTPSFVYKKTVKKYLWYFDENIWQKNTDNAPFPTLLFVGSKESVKKQLHKLENDNANRLELFFTFVANVKKEENDIWEQIF